MKAWRVRSQSGAALVSEDAASLKGSPLSMLSERGESDIPSTNPFDLPEISDSGMNFTETLRTATSTYGAHLG